MVLRRSGCWEIVNGTISKPSTRDAREKWEIKSEEGLTSIGLTVDTDQYQYIQDATTGPEAWEALSKVYEKRSRANRIALKREFYGYQHNLDAPIQDYISGILGSARKLKAIGVKLEDTDIMDVLLFNLHADWSNIAGTLCATTDDLDTISDITGSLQDEEGRRGGYNETPNVVMQATGGCSNCGKLGHSKAQCWAKGGGKEGQGRCFNCQKEGHLARNCLETDSDNNANYVSAF